MTPKSFVLCIIHSYINSCTRAHHFCMILVNRGVSGKTRRASQVTAGDDRRRNWQYLLVLCYIYKCERSVETHTPWRQTLPSFKPSHYAFSFFFQRLKNKGQTLKTERRVFTTRVGPSLGAYLSFELLADVLSVLLDEIMKSHTYKNSNIN